MSRPELCSADYAETETTLSPVRRAPYPLVFRLVRVFSGVTNTDYSIAITSFVIEYETVFFIFYFLFGDGELRRKRCAFVHTLPGSLVLWSFGSASTVVEIVKNESINDRV